MTGPSHSPAEALTAVPASVLTTSFRGARIVNAWSMK